MNRCPACRKEVVLDMHGVHSLPRNAGAEKMIAGIEKWHADVKKGVQIKVKKPKKRKYVIPSCPIKEHHNQTLIPEMHCGLYTQFQTCTSISVWLPGLVGK